MCLVYCLTLPVAWFLSSLYPANLRPVEITEEFSLLLPDEAGILLMPGQKDGCT